jgi:hypothetical protein
MLAALRGLPAAGVGELYLHPALASGAAIAPSMRGYRHADEFAALIAPRVRAACAALRDQGWRFGGYADVVDLAGPGGRAAPAASAASAAPPAPAASAAPAERTERTERTERAAPADVADVAIGADTGTADTGTNGMTHGRASTTRATPCNEPASAQPCPADGDASPRPHGR